MRLCLVMSFLLMGGIAMGDAIEVDEELKRLKEWECRAVESMDAAVSLMVQSAPSSHPVSPDHRRAL